MRRREILDRIEKYVQPFRITKGDDFKLADFDPGDTRGLRLDKDYPLRRMIFSARSAKPQARAMIPAAKSPSESPFERYSKPIAIQRMPKKIRTNPPNFFANSIAPSAVYAAMTSLL
jgi:hypothetical protein